MYFTSSTALKGSSTGYWTRRGEKRSQQASVAVIRLSRVMRIWFSLAMNALRWYYTTALGR